MAEGNIFISYRRGPDSNAAGRLHDRLERSFDKEQLFFDVDAIPLGVDFAEYIDEKVGQCRVQLVLIGQGWLGMTERLQDPDDFVRIEIEAALRRPDIPVIPVLLDGADMPTRDVLPESMHPLVRRNAITITHAQFAGIVDGRLRSELEGLMGEVLAADEVMEAQKVETPSPQPDAGKLGETAPADRTPTLRRNMSAVWLVPLGFLVISLWALWGDMNGDQEAVETRGVKDVIEGTPTAEGKPLVEDTTQQGVVYFAKGECIESVASNSEWRLIAQSNMKTCLSLCTNEQSCTGITASIQKNKSCVLHQSRIAGADTNVLGSTCFIKK